MFNQTIVVGYLGKDPEMRYTPTGTPVTNFSVASNRKWTGADGETKEQLLWFRVSAWGKTAEACNEYLKKGSMVMVIGQLQGDEKGVPRIWQGQDGIAHASFELRAREIRFLSRSTAEPVVTDDEQGITPTTDEQLSA